MKKKQNRKEIEFFYYNQPEARRHMGRGGSEDGVSLFETITGLGINYHPGEITTGVYPAQWSILAFSFPLGLCMGISGYFCFHGDLEASRL